MKCKDCIRYGDLHSSCDKARELKVEPDDKACENFKGYKKLKPYRYDNQEADNEARI